MLGAHIPEAVVMGPRYGVPATPASRGAPRGDDRHMSRFEVRWQGLSALTRQPGAIVRSRVIDRRALGNDAARIDARNRPIIDHVIARLHRLGDAGHLIKLAHVIREIGIVSDAL